MSQHINHLFRHLIIASGLPYHSARGERPTYHDPPSSVSYHTIQRAQLYLWCYLCLLQGLRLGLLRNVARHGLVCLSWYISWGPGKCWIQRKLQSCNHYDGCCWLGFWDWSHSIDNAVCEERAEQGGQKKKLQIFSMLPHCMEQFHHCNEPA